MCVRKSKSALMAAMWTFSTWPAGSPYLYRIIFSIIEDQPHSLRRRGIQSFDISTFLSASSPGRYLCDDAAPTILAALMPPSTTPNASNILPNTVQVSNLSINHRSYIHIPRQKLFKTIIKSQPWQEFYILQHFDTTARHEDAIFGEKIM